MHNGFHSRAKGQTRPDAACGENGVSRTAEQRKLPAKAIDAELNPPQFAASRRHQPIEAAAVRQLILLAARLGGSDACVRQCHFSQGGIEMPQKDPQNRGRFERERMRLGVAPIMTDFWEFSSRPRALADGQMVPAEGFEPPTFGLQNRCTTTVLSRPGGALALNCAKGPALGLR
jgi:hypothetical protein